MRKPKDNLTTASICGAHVRASICRKLRSSDQAGIASQKIAGGPGHAESVVRVVDLVRAGAQLRNLGVLACIPIEPGQHFLHRRPNRFGIVVLNVHAAMIGEIAARMAI